jgi:threonylcarbamoyladenosine tRNA methylthiotransferase MtaB
VRFSKVHLFPYSVRQRTRAALYPNQISSEVIRDRKNQLLRVSEQTAFALREQFVGRTMEVLLEDGEEEQLYGHTENFLRVQVPRAMHKPNEIVQVVLERNAPDGLIGR